MKEGNILKRIQVALSNIGARVFRNQVGRYLLVDGRYLQSGLVKGSSDLVGWHSVTITPAMVGRKIAVFVACEVKGPKTAVTPEQYIFIENVKRAGGIAFIARSPEEAVTELQNFHP